MSYKILIIQDAYKQLQSLPEHLREEAYSQIQALRTMPRPSDAQEILGTKGFRFYIEDYRVIYDIYDETTKIIILDISLRYGHGNGIV